jgi:hypothetical protein
MSLTSYLTGPEHQALRDKFKSDFNKPIFELNKKIVAPPLTANYAIVGSAFDYLLRFYLQYHYKDKVSNGSWVANLGFRQIQARRSFNQNFISDVQQRLTLARKHHGLFLTNGRMTADLLSDSLFLAKLDLTYRAGLIADDLLVDHPDDIADLRRLYTRIPKTAFQVNHSGRLNPGFMSSDIVGGADADLIIDDTLIEIKCVKDLCLKRCYLNQLIAYYLLTLLHNQQVEAEKRYTINRLGIYFARHAVLYTFPVSDLGTKKKIGSFADLFWQYTTSYNQMEEDIYSDFQMDQGVKTLLREIKLKERKAKRIVGQYIR